MAEQGRHKQVSGSPPAGAPPEHGETLEDQGSLDSLTSNGPEGDGAAPGSPSYEQRPRADGRLKVGDLINGRYRLERRLGTGGMGEVYVAQDEVVERAVAIKLLNRRHTDNPMQVRRFHREAHIMRRLDSPHAVRVHDFGQTEDGLPYLVMEYLEGETLSSLLERQGPLEPSQAIRIALAVLAGLTEAHRRGVVHRDIKPANIFLTHIAGGHEPLVKILDFGLAKVWDQEQTELTTTGAIYGTPRYISPEQVRGHPVDHRCDLFSLGVILYRALTGVLPFDGRRPEELIYTLLHTTPEPLTRRRPDLGLSPEFDRVVLRAIEKEPKARYQSAEEMADDLRALLAGLAAPPKRRRGRVMPGIVRAGVVALLAATLLAGLEFPIAVRTPFPGFAIESGLLVSPMTRPDWPGFQRGIQPYDVILAVDGMRVRTTGEVRAHIGRLAPGTPVIYTLRRGERMLELEVPVSRLAWRDLLQLYGGWFLVGLAFIFIGSIAAWNRPLLPEAQALLLFTACFGCSLSLAHDVDLVGWMPWLFRLAISTLGAACVHLGLVFPSPLTTVRQRPWLLALLYGLGIAHAAVWHLFASDPMVGVACTYLSTAACLLGVIALFGLLLWRRYRAAALSERQAARFTLWAAVLSMLPVITVSLLPLLWGAMDKVLGSWFWLATLPLIILPVAFALQIRRRQLVDLDRVLSQLGRALAHFALLVALLGVVSGGVVLAFRLFDGDRSLETIFAALLGVGAVSLVSGPLSRRLDPVFARHAGLHPPSIIAEFANTTRDAESGDELIDVLFETLRRCYRPLVLRLIERARGGYVVRLIGVSGASTRPATRGDFDVEGVEPTEERHRPLSSKDVQRHLSQLGRWKAHAFLVLSLDEGSADEQTIATSSALVVVGPRADGRAYSSDDAAVVSALVHLAGARLDALNEIPTLEEATDPGRRR